jgi:hypothetical protein
LSDLAATLGVPAPFEFEGKTYSVSPVNVEVAAAFEVWLEGRALDAIRRHAPNPASPERLGAGLLLPGEHMAAHEIWQRDVACGLYEFEGPVALSARYSLAGRKHLALLQLQFASKGVTPHLVDRIFKDRGEGGALERLQAAQAQVAAPNGQGPAGSVPAGQTPPGSSGAAEPAPVGSASA